MKNILIFAPHGDDEWLGMGGYILKEIKNNSIVNVVFCTDGFNDEHSSIRLNEIKKVSEIVGFNYEVLYHNMDKKLNTISDAELVGKLDYYLELYKPDEVFCCYRSHHQDHKKLYDCCQSALRLKEYYIPKLFGLYEYPFINEENKINGGLMYIDISDVIEQKKEIFKLYKSQNKKLPSPLSINGIDTLAKFRGMNCGKTYAELIYIQRIIL